MFKRGDLCRILNEDCRLARNENTEAMRDNNTLDNCKWIIQHRGMIIEVIVLNNYDILNVFCYIPECNVFCYVDKDNLEKINKD